MIGWEDLEDSLEELETEKEHKGYFYKVEDMVKIVLIGSLCGLRSVKQIHTWATSKNVEEALKSMLGLERIPSYPWLLTLIGLVSPESMSACMQTFAGKMMKKGEGYTIAVDGKTVRSTEKMKDYERALHIVNAYVSEIGVTLAHKACESKGNEITCTQEMLKSLSLGKHLVVTDAMNCQVETAGIIVENKGDYLLSVKDNQKNLCSDISEFVEDKNLRAKMERSTTTERGHGRKEVRTAYSIPLSSLDSAWKIGGRQWPNLKSFGAIHTKFTVGEKTGDNWHYYISSRELSAKYLLKHARLEWAVESMHWLLDVHFGEDYCRVKNKNVQMNLSAARKLALSIVKRYKTETNSRNSLSNLMLMAMLDCERILLFFD